MYSGAASCFIWGRLLFTCHVTVHFQEEKTVNLLWVMDSLGIGLKAVDPLTFPAPFLEPQGSPDPCPLTSAVPELRLRGLAQGESPIITRIYSFYLDEGSWLLTFGVEPSCVPQKTLSHAKYLSPFLCQDLLIILQLKTYATIRSNRGHGVNDCAVRSCIRFFKRI